MYILVIDPDHFANTLVQFVLSKEGYEVETIDNPSGAMRMIELREPDLLILEVIMPSINGFDFVEKLRSTGYETPFIFVTAQNSLESILRGLDIGADDYICKPYNHQELVARVQALMRRLKKANRGSAHCIRSGQVELDLSELKVVISGHVPIQLTPTEAQLLKILMTAEGQILNRDQLLVEVWNDTETNSNIVDVYVRRLRMKIEEDPDKPRHVISIRGIGYKFLGK